MGSTDSNRRHEFDWIRVMAILVVFFYHSSRFFNLGTWHLKNINIYVWVEVVQTFVRLWMMPVFFLVSGAGIYFVLKKNISWGNFYKSKFSRLMVPLIVGILTHCMFQIYFERISHGQFSGSFFSFVPGYFSGLYLEMNGIGNFPFHGMHLWYLLFLFVYSLVLFLPFKWLLDRSGALTLEKITSFAAIPGIGWLAFSLPLIGIKLLLPAGFTETGNGGWGFVYYFWFLIAGFMIISNGRLMQQIRKQRYFSLLLGICFTAIYLYGDFSTAAFQWPFREIAFGVDLLKFFCSWFWLFVILGFAMQHLAWERPVLKSLNEGVLPFYVLHQSVLICVGYFITAMEIHDGLKWALTTSVSFILILTVYFKLIRKFDLMRWLFGMKPLRPQSDKPIGRKTLAAAHVIYIGLIALAIADPFAAYNTNRLSSKARYDRQRDVILESQDIFQQSTAGIQLIDKKERRDALLFLSGESQKPVSVPEVYAETRFKATAGYYVIWLRGKCDTGSILSDSVWLQFDEQIGTGRATMAGNWLDIHPADAWNWAGNGTRLAGVTLKYSGEHTLRIIPRQTPHAIDQIWLSRFQYRVPDTGSPID